jgi:solute carrier family 25 carnitine/acylcarnitine transporter 20/29
MFWSYEGAKRYQLRTYEQTELSINQIALAGAASGLPLACVLGPLERIKCLMQVNKTAGLDSFGHAVRYVYQQGGFPSLFRGTALTVCRDVPGNAAYFAGYECVRRMLGAPAEGSSAVAVTLFAGGMAGVMNWIVAIPVDVLKSRWQTSNQFHSVAHLLRDLLEKEGPGALCKGLRPALLRAFPANAACLLGVETANSFLALFQR